MEGAVDQQESVAPQEDEEALLPFLPDDVQVMVFACLAASELLGARLVCRRWAELALHQDAWRHRDVAAPNAVQEKKQGVSSDLEAALRLAPCVRTLDLRGLFDGRRSVLPREVRLRLGALAATTRCAAKHLVVDVVSAHDRDVSMVSILRNQLSLGRLRELKMDVFMDVYYTLAADSSGIHSKVQTRADSVELVLAGCNAEGLTRLEVSVDTPEGFYEKHSANRVPVPVAKPIKPSLKALVFAVKDSTWWPLALRLVDGHAATLESLSVVGLPDGPLGSGRPWAESAAAVAGLRELDCPLMRGMNAFLKCDKLESLVLRVGDVVAAAANLHEAAAFLRGRAAQLQKMTIKTGDSTDWSTPEFTKSVTAVMVGLLEALASSSRATLSVLRLEVSWGSGWGSAVLGRLTAALEHLPALGEVRVLVESGDAVLPLAAAVSRATSCSGARPPTLRVQLRNAYVPCAHAWMHGHAHKIAKLFEECPSFHLELDDDGKSRGASCGTTECFACGERCHGSAPWKEKKRMVLYGHLRDEPCDSPEHADDGVACYRLGYQLYSCR